MTKACVRAKYKGEWVGIKDGDEGSEVVLIGAMNTPDYLVQLAYVVLEVKRIKGR